MLTSEAVPLNIAVQEYQIMNNTNRRLRIRNLLLLLSLCFSLLYKTAEAGQEVLAAQSIRIPPYEEAIRGFKSVCHAGMHRIAAADLSEKTLKLKIRTYRPRLVLAVGMAALSKVKQIRDLPVVYLMVFNAGPILSSERNFKGVCMNISQERQLEILLKAVPVNHVGLVYDPARTADLVKKARDASIKLGINLIAKEVNQAKDVPVRIREMKGKVQALWMLPDLTVVTPECVKCMLLFSLENQIPILTFSEKYLPLGALMSISIEAFDMGRQAGRMANKILTGKPVQNIAPRKAAVCINLKIAKKLGIDINKQAFKDAKFIN